MRDWVAISGVAETVSPNVRVHDVAVVLGLEGVMVRVLMEAGVRRI